MDFEVNPDCKVCDGTGTEAHTGAYSGVTSLLACGECSGADKEYRDYLRENFPKEYAANYYF